MYFAFQLFNHDFKDNSRKVAEVSRDVALVIFHHLLIQAETYVYFCYCIILKAS